MRRIIFHPASHVIGVMELNPVTKQVNMNMFPNTQAVRDGLKIPNDMPPTIIDEGPINGFIKDNVSQSGYRIIIRPDSNAVTVPNVPGNITYGDKVPRIPVSEQDIKDVKKNLRWARNFDRLLGKKKN